MAMISKSIFLTVRLSQLWHSGLVYQKVSANCCSINLRSWQYVSMDPLTCLTSVQLTLYMEHLLYSLSSPSCLSRGDPRWSLCVQFSSDSNWSRPGWAHQWLGSCERKTWRENVLQWLSVRRRTVLFVWKVGSCWLTLLSCLLSNDLNFGNLNKKVERCQ